MFSMRFFFPNLLIKTIRHTLIQTAFRRKRENRWINKQCHHHFIYLMVADIFFPGICLFLFISRLIILAYYLNLHLACNCCICCTVYFDMSMNRTDQKNMFIWHVRNRTDQKNLFHWPGFCCRGWVQKEAQEVGQLFF